MSAITEPCPEHTSPSESEGTLRQIQWKGIFVGLVGTLWFAVMLVGLVEFAISPHIIFNLSTDPIPGSGPAFVSGREWDLYQILNVYSFSGALILAFFGGSLVVGAMVSSSPVLNGMLSSVAGLAVGSALLLGGALVWSMPGDIHARFEELGAIVGFLFS